MQTVSRDSVTIVDSPPPRFRYGFGLFGLSIGVIGLALAVGRPHIAEALERARPKEPPQKLSDALADAGDKFVGRMIDRVRGKKHEAAVRPPRPEPTPWLWYFSIVATGLGFAGSLSGTVSWIRREDHRLAASAIVAGALAVAWVYIIAALVIAFVIFFLLILLGSVGS
jgi:hypothetical protein